MRTIAEIANAIALANGNLLAALMEIRSCTFASLVARKNIKMKKNSPLANAEVYEVKEYENLQISYGYENSVQNREERATGERTFEGEKLPFGEWVKYPTIISNKGRYMVRFYANKNTKSRVAYYTINGKIATAEEVELIASGRYAESKHTASAKQTAVGIAADDQCKPFNKYFEDIILVTFNGTTYCGDKATATKVAI